MAKKIVAALEEENLEILSTPVGSDLDTDIPGLNNIENELSIKTTQSADLESAACALDDISDTITCSLDEDITKENAAVVAAAIESICNINHISHKKMIATEAFANPETRLEAAHLALENIKETAGKIWDTLVRWISDFIEWVADMFNKIFHNASQLNKKAKELLPKIKELKGTPKQTTIESSYLFDSLQVEGIVPANFEKELNTFSKFIELSIRLAEHSASEFQSNVRTYYNVIGGSITYTPNMFKLFTLKDDTKGLGNALVTPAKLGLANLDPNLKVVTSECMFGNRAIVAVTPSKALVGAQAFEVINKVFTKVLNITTAADYHVKETPISVADLNLMEKICHMVIESTDAINAFKSKESLHASMRKDLKHKLAVLNDKIAFTSEAAEALSYIRKLTRWMILMLDEPVMSMTAHTLRTSKALLTYVGMSAKQYQ